MSGVPRCRVRRLAGRWPLLGALVLAAMLMPASCGGDEPAPPRQNSPVTSTGVTLNDTPPAVTFRRVFAGLTFSQPVFLTWAPGAEERLAVVEQEGRIWLFPQRDGVRRDEAILLLDISGKVKSGGEEGMLGLAFDPLFESNGFFYVYYSADSPRRSVISRFSVDPASPETADPAGEQIILEVEQPQSFGNHKAGMIAFGPDGMFYIALGDGGGSGDPRGNAQNLGTLLGKILRLDLSEEPYAVPTDNPFTETGGARGEIWAYGLRNPYRFSFDRETGEMWAGDVGEGNREEVDLVIQGGNYGWDFFEGTREFDKPAGRRAEEFIPPVTEYGHGEGRSVIGGYVYRGSESPSLAGTYFFADFYSGRIWALRYRDNRVIFDVEVANLPSISSFGEDRSGEVYAVTYEGAIYQLAERA